MTKQRVAFLDYAKAIGIILVVLGHVINTQGNILPSGKIVLQYIYSFHMPLFFLVYFLIGLYFRKYCFNNKEINIRNITTFKKLHYTYYHWYAYFLIHI